MTDHSDDFLQEARALADEFEVLEGRRPRMYLAGLAPDDAAHTKTIAATVFSDMGWDVDVGPEEDSAEGAAQDASDNDVHVIGFFPPEKEGREVFLSLVWALADARREDILIFAFGAAAEEDGAWYADHGACAVCGAGTDLRRGCFRMLQALVDMAGEEAREG